MKHGQIFGEAWRWLWQHPGLWLVGIVLSSVTLAGTAVRWWLFDYFIGQFILDPQNVNWLVRRLQFVEGKSVLGWTVLFLAVGLLLWLLMTAAEAGLIEWVLALREKRPFSLRQLLAAGKRWLGIFIAVDTLLFLPWFLVTLAAMLVFTAVIVGLILVTANGRSPDSAPLAGMMVSFLCLVPFVGLSLVTALLTMAFRPLVLRQMVMQPAGVRTVIRQTWQQGKRHWSDILILLALLWGIAYVFRTGSQLAEMAVISLGWASHALWLTLIRLLMWALVALFSVGLRTWTAVTWTVAWHELLTQETPSAATNHHE
ncbi:MAG: hypothetical protein Kow0080_33820 [Candidatus Promineifilaceae bacterium]